jgi:hypothetical protein
VAWSPHATQAAGARWRAKNFAAVCGKRINRPVALEGSRGRLRSGAL